MFRCRRNAITTAAAAATLGAVIATLAANMAVTQEGSLQDIAKALPVLPQIVIYQAKEIVTLDPAKPTAQAVAVVGDRILAVGQIDELKSLAGKQPFVVSTTFADQVIVPGFVAQHDHPFLAALTMTSEIIAIEDWVLPQGTSKAAKSREEYLKRLADANAKLTDPNDVLLTWGYHQYFHGALKKADLDAISSTRPIIVWHRSAHEFYLNSVAEKKYNVTRAWYDSWNESQKKQSDFDNAHYWEQGMFALAPPDCACHRLAGAASCWTRIHCGVFSRQWRNAGLRAGRYCFEAPPGRRKRGDKQSRQPVPLLLHSGREIRHGCLS